MAAPVVAPDASVILKWVLPSAGESDVGSALALRDAIVAGEVRALAPELWYRVRVPVGDLPYQGVEEVIEPS